MKTEHMYGHITYECDDCHRTELATVAVSGYDKQSLGERLKRAASDGNSILIRKGWTESGFRHFCPICTSRKNS